MIYDNNIGYLDLIKNKTYNSIYDYLPGTNYNKADGFKGFVNVLLTQLKKSYREAWKNVSY